MRMLRVMTVVRITPKCVGGGDHKHNDHLEFRRSLHGRTAKESSRHHPRDGYDSKYAATWSDEINKPLVHRFERK